MKKKCCHVRMLSPNKSCSKDNLDRVIDVQQYNPLLHQQFNKRLKDLSCKQPGQQTFPRLFVQKVGTRTKKKKNDGGGGGERRKRLYANPTILKNCVRPRKQLLIGAVRVTVLITLALKTSIKQGMLCLHASQI